MCENLVWIGGAFQELSCPQNFFPGGRNPLLGGLHLTCEAYFRARMSYSSRKSCVKIRSGLVEIGGMLSLRGAEDPPIRGGGGVTCNLRCPFSNLAEVF